MRWTVYKCILLSGDIEMNPGPGNATFIFCSWKLNSICAHDFMRIVLLEAYNAIHDYYLIGIVEIHLNDTVDETKLTLNGYSLTINSHSLSRKRGGFGLYYKESLPIKQCHDLEVLLECIVCEIYINQKKYFFCCTV